MRHTSRFSCLLGMKASLSRVFQSGLNTGGGAMVGGARGTITEVESEAKVKDGRVDATGCVGPCYPIFVVFNVLGSRGILII
jgi:hypothetical protein